MPAKMGGVIYALTAMEHRWSLEQIACEILRYSDNKLVHHNPVDGEVSKAVTNFKSELSKMRRLERVPNDIKNVINDGAPSGSKNPKGFTRDQLEIILPHLSKPADKNLTKILVFPGDEPSGPLQGSLLDMLEQKPEIRPEPKQEPPKAELQQILDLPQSRSVKTEKRETEFDCRQAVLNILADGQWHALTRRRSPGRAVSNCQSRRNKAKAVCTELISQGVIESRNGTNRAIEYRLCSVATQQPTTVRRLELKSRVEQKIVDFFDRSDSEWIAVRDIVGNVFSAKQDRELVPIVFDAWLSLGVVEEQHRCNRNRTISRLIRLNPDVEFVPFCTEEPATNAVTVVEPPGAIDLYTRRQFRQAAMEGFDSSRMEEALSSAKALLWAQWQGEKWMTTRQVADFLGLTVTAIDKNFQRNRQEFLEASEVRTLRGVDLKGFQEETDSKSVSLESPLVGKFANAVNLYSVAGVLRMAWMSDGPMGRAVRDFTMKLVHSLPAMVEQGVKLGRDQRLDTVSSADLAHGAIIAKVADIVQQLGPDLRSAVKQGIKECQPLLTQVVDGEFAGISPNMTICNQVVESLGLPTMFTSAGLPNWHCWAGGKPVVVPLPVIYVIFADLERVGRLRECFSAGRGGPMSGRISHDRHERIKLLISKQIHYKVLWTQVQASTMKDSDSLEKSIEKPLQEHLKTLWEWQWNKDGRELFTANDPLFA